MATTEPDRIFLLDTMKYFPIDSRPVPIPQAPLLLQLSVIKLLHSPPIPPCTRFLADLPITSLITFSSLAKAESRADKTAEQCALRLAIYLNTKSTLRVTTRPYFSIRPIFPATRFALQLLSRY
jgi:hypothetical protein